MLNTVPTTWKILDKWRVVISILPSTNPEPLYSYAGRAKY